MAVKIDIPTPLREHTGGKAQVEVTGATVQDALNDLVKRYSAIGPKLFDQGRLRPYINVFLNDEDIRYLDELKTPVKDGELIALIPAVAGG
jgi:molybdopterin synthase sulfur carrier subunit